MRRFIGVLYLLLLTVISRQVQGQREQLEALPRPQKDYVVSRYAAMRMRFAETHERLPLLKFDPHITVAVEADSGRWLLGLSFGWTDERVRRHISDVVLVSQSGDEVWRFPHVDLGEDYGNLNTVAEGLELEGAVYVYIANAEALVGIATENSRWGPSIVQLASLASGGRIMETFDGKAEGRHRFSESMFYFYDADGDGRTDVLINRRIHTRQPGGGYKYENQKLAYRILAGGSGLAPAAFSVQDLVRVIGVCKADPTIPHLPQHGFPFENVDDPALGEAIFPEEERWRRISYSGKLPVGPAINSATNPSSGEGNASRSSANAQIAAAPSDASTNNAKPAEPPEKANRQPEDRPKWPWVVGAIVFILTIVIILKRRT